MTYDGVERPGRLEVGSATDWRQWIGDGLTGSLTLAFRTEGEGWVSPGTGRLTLDGAPGFETVTLAAARSAGRPVLPGSGIKGAVRVLYELITGSCTPFDPGGGCGGCPACSLFGSISPNVHRGRLGFDDALGEGDVRIDVETVPLPFEPHGENTPGDVRLYDLAGKEGAQRVLAHEVYRGRFEGRLIFDNASELEIGRVMLCLGLGPPELRFALRLGGVKYDGQGAVRVELASALLVKTPLVRERLSEGELRTRADAWAVAALEGLGIEHRQALERAVSILRRRKS